MPASRPLSAEGTPVTAALGLTVGAVWAQPDGRALVRAMFDEVAAVAAREGVTVDRIGAGQGRA